MNIGIELHKYSKLGKHRKYILLIIQSNKSQSEKVNGETMKLKSISECIQCQIIQVQQGGITVVKRKFVTLTKIIFVKFPVPIRNIILRIILIFFEKVISHNPKAQWAYAGILPLIKFQLDYAASPHQYSRQFLKYFYPYLKMNPVCILKWRLTAYHSCWWLLDQKGIQEIGQAYIDTQNLLVKQHEIDFLNFRLANDIFFSNYNVQGFLDTHIKAMLLGWAPNARIVALIDSDQMKNVTNPWMLKYWRKYVDIVNDQNGQRLLSRFSPYCLDDLTVIANLNGQATYIEYARHIVQKQWEKEKRAPLLELDQDDIIYGREMMLKLGLPKDAWFVSLHVRDPGCKTGSYLNNDKVDAYRNADIDTYYEAVNSIVNRGGYVVRVGDPDMKPAKPMKGLIDYAHSQIRSSRLDIFLFTQCRFFIGTISGPILHPYIFGVPVIGTNCGPLITRLPTGNSLMINKLIWDTKNNRPLGFREALSSEIGRAFNLHAYKERDLWFIDNTPEDLADVTVEMMDILDGNLQYSYEDDLLQERINQIYREFSFYGDTGRFGRNFLIKIAKQGLL